MFEYFNSFYSYFFGDGVGDDVAPTESTDSIEPVEDDAVPTTGWMQLQAVGDGVKNTLFTTSAFGGAFTAAVALIIADLELTFDNEINIYCLIPALILGAGCGYAKYRADLAQSKKQQAPITLPGLKTPVCKLPPLKIHQGMFTTVQLGLNVMVDSFGLFGILQTIDFSKFGSRGKINEYGLEITVFFIAVNTILNLQSFFNTKTSYRKANLIQEQGIKIKSSITSLSVTSLLLVLQLSGDWLKTSASASYIPSKLLTDVLHKTKVKGYPYDIQEENNQYLLLRALLPGAGLAAVELGCKYRANQNINIEELLEQEVKHCHDQESGLLTESSNMAMNASLSIGKKLKLFAVSGADAISDAATDYEITNTAKVVALHLLAQYDNPAIAKYSWAIVMGMMVFNMSTNMKTWQNDYVALKQEAEEEQNKKCLAIKN